MNSPSQDNPHPGRRRWLLGGAAIGAFALGSGAWQLFREQGASPAALETLFAHPFDTPGGEHLLLSSLRGAPLLVNFWATWCAPCREEIPLLARAQAARSANGLQIVGIAIDNLDRVRQYDKDSPLGYRIGVAGIGLVSLLQQLGDAAGALPYSLLFDRTGKLVEQRLGAWSAAGLDRALDRLGA
jgi:thiol-disulfide isomerase/thioredoxin